MALFFPFYDMIIIIIECVQEALLPNYFLQPDAFQRPLYQWWSKPICHRSTKNFGYELDHMGFKSASWLKTLFVIVFFSGCDLLFADETDDNSLPFFPSGSVRQKTINVPANQNCSFYFKDEVHVNYLRCDGTWKLENVADTIDLTSGWSISQLSIKV